jgi:hypothetical protein
MYSVQGDTVLDPFMGTGTTMQAAMATGRSSVGYEIDSELEALLMADPAAVCRTANDQIDRRLADHQAFVAAREADGKPIKHTNRPYGFPVVTRQETGLYLPRPVRMASPEDHRWRVTYQPQPPEGAVEDAPPPAADRPAAAKQTRPRQRELFN